MNFLVKTGVTTFRNGFPETYHCMRCTAHETEGETTIQAYRSHSSTNQGAPIIFISPQSQKEKKNTKLHRNMYKKDGRKIRTKPSHTRATPAHTHPVYTQARKGLYCWNTSQRRQVPAVRRNARTVTKNESVGCNASPPLDPVRSESEKKAKKQKDK